MLAVSVLASPNEAGIVVLASFKATAGALQPTASKPAASGASRRYLFLSIDVDGFS